MIVLGTYPTPIVQVRQTWVKRDDLTGARYGGNKVRKLERFFSQALRKGRRRILTVGAVGSHQVVATAIYGKELGFETHAVLVPQPDSPHARANIATALAHGLVPHPVHAWALVPLAIARATTTRTYFVPLGGSNPIGTLGFVDAAAELAAQIEAKVLPEPDVVVTALGSGGTAAGLAVGFEKLGMKTRVIGVGISEPTIVLEPLARRLAKGTARLAHLSSRAALAAADRIRVDLRWLGSGYGHPTPAGANATRIAAEHGLVLDPTYTAKAFACALATSDGPETVLFWNTYAGHVHDPAVATAPLPPDVERLLT